MIISFYLFSFIASFALLALLLIEIDDNVSQGVFFFALTFLLITILDLGYFYLVRAKTLEEALVANQFTYFGGCFATPCLFLVVAELCKFKIKRKLAALLFVPFIILFALSCSIGQSPIFYKAVSLCNAGTFAYLDKTYGPLHALYPATMTFALFGMWVMIIFALARRSVSRKTIFLICTFLSVTVAMYLLSRILKLKFECMPFAYLVDQVIILILLHRIKTYNVVAFTALSLVSNDEYGIILCSDKGLFLGCNAVAENYFPELSKQSLDVKINDDSEIGALLAQFVKENKNQQPIIFKEINNSIIKVMYRPVATKRFLTKKRIFHCVMLVDDTEQQKYLRLLNQYNETLNSEVMQKTLKLQDIQNDIIMSMASIVENRDGNTGGHIKRTSHVMKVFVEYLEKTGRCYELTPKVKQCLIQAAPLHDFGKIAIPDSVLNKPGTFCDKDYEVMREHAEKGAIIVNGILQNQEDYLFKNIAVNMAHYHHEKWDGTGYPAGKKEQEIPFEARVMALVDVFDALVSKRAYKDSINFDDAFDIVQKSLGTHFDPVIGTCFIACRPQLEKLYIKLLLEEETFNT